MHFSPQLYLPLCRKIWQGYCHCSWVVIHFSSDSLPLYWWHTMHALPSTPLSYVQTVIAHYQPKLSEGTVNSLKDFLHIHQSSLVVLLLPQHHPPSPPSFQIHFLINRPHNTVHLQVGPSQKLDGPQSKQSLKKSTQDAASPFTSWISNQLGQCRRGIVRQ